MYHVCTLRIELLYNNNRYMMSILPSKIYRPCKLFSKNSNYGIMVLNSESFKLETDFFRNIWNNAEFRHVIDGGSNYFYRIHEECERSNIPLLDPHIATGDFDSIERHVLKFLRSDSTITKVLPTVDQDETDFVKGLHILNQHVTENHVELEFVIALAENCGRLDHTMGNINTLHKSSLKKETDLFILSSDSLTWLMQPEMRNEIDFGSNTTTIDKVCGIIPMNGPTRMRSSGLKWNLNNEIYRFGGVISTSNRMVQNKVCIESDDNPVLLTLEMSPTDFILASTNN